MRPAGSGLHSGWGDMFRAREGLDHHETTESQAQWTGAGVSVRKIGFGAGTRNEEGNEDGRTFPQQFHILSTSFFPLSLSLLSFCLTFALYST